MEDNLILEGLLSMVTELKEKLEAQVTPASREETIERFGAIEQALSRLHTNPAVSVEKLQTIQSQLDDVRNKMQGQQQHIEDTKRISLEMNMRFQWKRILGQKAGILGNSITEPANKKSIAN